jgi:predicted AAA+ superfamily ATPase
MLNYSAIASDAEVKRSTVQNYFQILEETLLGYRLKPWIKSKNRKAIGTEKFYFFDTGLVNVLVGRKSVALNTHEGGFLFETLVLNEIRAYNDYSQMEFDLSFWKSTSDFAGRKES